MGMFDWVQFEARCPTCGAMLNDFQSKDGFSALRQLRPGQLVAEVGGPAKIYDYCDNCKKMVTFKVIPTHKIVDPEVEIIPYDESEDEHG